MYAIFCGVHIVVLAGVAILFLMCIRNTTSPAKLSFMLTCFSLFILIFGMYLEMLDSDTTQEAILALKMQYIGMYPFSLSLLYFTSSMGGFRVPKPMWITLGVLDSASFIAMQTTATTPEKSHGLFYSSMKIEYDGIYSRINVGKGPFWFITYSVILFIIIFIIVNLIQALRKTGNRIQHRRIALILGGISAMGIELVMKWCGLFGSYNPFAFGAFVLVFCMYESMIRYGYFASVVSAPANVLDSGDEGVVMLDEHGGLIYMNATAKRILPELSEMKTASSHAILKEALSGEVSTVSIGGSVYELRAERIQEFSSPCGYVIWLINMTKYQQRLDEINAANAAKSEFLARMSHEIRTPINTMLGLNEMVMRTSSNPEVQEYSADIADAGGMLLTLINEILDISKAESGMLTVERTEYDTLTLFREIRLLVVQKAEEKGLELDFRISPELPRRLTGDPARIKQMAVNLLTNAVKYTQTGFVRLTAEMDGGAMVLTIADSGCGIAPEKLPLIFNNFERIGAVGDGVGLGLPITKNIVEIMGGSITAESTPGIGSTFTLKIPQDTADAAPMGEFTPELPVRAPVIKQHFTCPGVRILAVDDNRYNRVVIEKLLRRTRAAVTTAESGSEMLLLTREQRFDLIMLDAMMPGMSGAEALRQLRSDPEGLCRDVPVAVLTADAVVGARERYLAEGFDEYLSKPIISEELEQMLIRLIPGEMSAGETAAPEAPQVSDADGSTILNIAKGLEYSDNDLDFYRELLQIFTDEAPKSLERLSQALSDGDLELYTTLVHGLKNNARGIGADAAGELCYEAEQAARAGNAGPLPELQGRITSAITEAAEEAERLSGLSGLPGLAAPEAIPQ